jgi:hypothetical protein
MTTREELNGTEFHSIVLSLKYQYHGFSRFQYNYKYSLIFIFLVITYFPAYSAHLTYNAQPKLFCIPFEVQITRTLRITRTPNFSAFLLNYI